MAQYKADFIKIPVVEGYENTRPTEPHRRMQQSDVSIELCDVNDVYKIVEGMHAAFPERFWNMMEPLEVREPDQSLREKRLAARLMPHFLNPNMKWIKAVLASTGAVVGMAGWLAPGNPIHNLWRRSAVDFYGWKEKMGWTDEDVEEMWKGTKPEELDEKLSKDDGIRKDLLGDEPHWYLAPLFIWPEYQGRGIGKRLLDWAIEQADATKPMTPLYLESAPTARAVYMHCGFVPQGETNFMRRGPATVRGLEAEEGNEAPELDEPAKVPVQVVEKEMEADMAS